MLVYIQVQAATMLFKSRVFQFACPKLSLPDRSSEILRTHYQPRTQALSFAAHGEFLCCDKRLSANMTINTCIGRLWRLDSFHCR